MEGAAFRNCGETRCKMSSPDASTCASSSDAWKKRLFDEPLRPLGTSAKCKALHLHSQRRELDGWPEVNVTPQKWEMSLSHDELGHQSTSLVKLLGSIRANVNWFSHQHTCSTVISSVVTHLYDNGVKSLAAW